MRILKHNFRFLKRLAVTFTITVNHNFPVGLWQAPQGLNSHVLSFFAAVPNWPSW